MSSPPRPHAQCRNLSYGNGLVIGTGRGLSRRRAGKPLSDAAKRALAEAAERRADIDRRAADIGTTPEQNGRGGLEPVRYEDWEIGGRAVDF
jgi:hypothetical protein